MPFIGVGLSFQRTAHEEVPALTIRIPHPNFFNAHASDATLGDTVLTRAEGSAHIQAMIVATPNSERMRVRLFGGPTYFGVTQETVDDIRYNQVFQIFGRGNTVDITTYEFSEAEGTGWSFHGGADVAFFFNRIVGVGGFARFSRGKSSSPTSAGSTRWTPAASKRAAACGSSSERSQVNETTQARHRYHGLARRSSTRTMRRERRVEEATDASGQGSGCSAQLDTRRDARHAVARALTLLPIPGDERDVEQFGGCHEQRVCAHETPFAGSAGRCGPQLLVGNDDRDARERLDRGYGAARQGCRSRPPGHRARRFGESKRGEEQPGFGRHPFEPLACRPVVLVIRQGSAHPHAGVEDERHRSRRQLLLRRVGHFRAKMPMSCATRSNVFQALAIPSADVRCSTGERRATASPR